MSKLYRALHNNTFLSLFFSLSYGGWGGGGIE